MPVQKSKLSFRFPETTALIGRLRDCNATWWSLELGYKFFKCRGANNAWCQRLEDVENEAEQAGKENLDGAASVKIQGRMLKTGVVELHTAGSSLSKDGSH